MGNAHALLGEITEAMNSFNTALEIIPNHPGALQGKAGLLIIHRKFSEAEEIIDKLATVMPNEPGIKQMKAAVYFFQDKHQKALEYINKLLETTPETPELLMMKAMTLHNLKQYQEATQTYDKVLETKPDDKYAEYLRENATNKIDIDMPPLPGVVTEESFNEEQTIREVHARCVAQFNQQGLSVNINATSTEDLTTDPETGEFIDTPAGGFSGAVAHGFGKMSYILNNLFGPEPPPVPPLTIQSITLGINGKTVTPSETTAPAEDAASATFNWSQIESHEGVLIQVRIRGRDKRIRTFNFPISLIIPIGVEITAITETTSPEKEIPLEVTYYLTPTGLQFESVQGTIQDLEGNPLYTFPEMGYTGENTHKWEFYDESGETMDLPRETELFFKILAKHDNDTVEATASFTVLEAEVIELTAEYRFKTGYKYVLL